MNRAEKFQQLVERLVDIADNLVPDRPFFPYQKEFAVRLVDAVLRSSSEELTALFARQMGKTEVETRVMVALALFLPELAEELKFLKKYRKGIWIGIFAPVKEQANTAYSRIVDILDSERCLALMAEAGITFKKRTASMFVLSNGSFIRTYSASPGANIESATLHIAVVEEAQDVGAYKLKKSIEPMLAATAGLSVLIGTANEKRSPFYEGIQRNKKLELRKNSRRRHFEYDWTVGQAYNPLYARWLNAKIEERGLSWLDTDEFKMAFALEFMLSRGMFCTLERFLELEALCGGIPRGPYNENGICILRAPIYFGIDWGKTRDSTVVTALARFKTHNQVVDWLELHGDDYDHQHDAIIKFLKRFPTGKIIVAESNGVGDPNVDRLKGAVRRGNIKMYVEGYWMDSASNADQVFKPLLQDFTNNNVILFPADEASRKSVEYDKFACQVTEAEKRYRGSLLKIQHPESPDAHDDYVYSLAFAHYAANQKTSDDMYRSFYGDDTDEKTELAGKKAS